VIDLLLINFQLPRSTLFMQVAALAGLDHIKAAYARAIARRYRLFSYGNACLIERPIGSADFKGSGSARRWHRSRWRISPFVQQCDFLSRHEDWTKN